MRVRRGRRIVIFLAVTAAVAVGAGACGSGGGRELARSAGSASETATAVDGVTEEGAAASPGSNEDAAIQPGAAAKSSAGSDGGATTTTVFDPASHPLAPKNPSPMRYGQVQHPQKDTVPVALKVESPDCANAGGTLQVTVVSEPDVDVAMIIGYSDGEGHDSQSLGTTGPEGRLVVQVPISPQAPAGDAQLLVVAGAPDGRRNHSERDLTIVKAAGSCG